MASVSPTSTAAPSADQAAAAERLLSAANDGAKSLKALFFWYVGALAYAVISVVGVADTQLLTETPLKLPILGVDIPFVEYFAFLPLVVVLIHMELLVQFALLSNKLHKLEELWPNDAKPDMQRRLENFMLSHLLVGKHRSVIRCLLFLLIYGALIVLPLFTLLLIQAQFLAYHSAPMMWWHRALISVDAVILLYFWPNLFRSDDLGLRDWLRLMACRVGPRVLLAFLGLAALYLVLASAGLRLTPVLFALGLAVIASIVLVIGEPRTAERFERIGGHVTLFAWAIACVVLLLLSLHFAGRLFGANLDAAELDGLGLSLAFLGVAILAGLVGAGIGDGGEDRWYGALGAAAAKGHLAARGDDAPGMTAFALQCAAGVLVSWLLLAVPQEDEASVALDPVCAQVFGPLPPTLLSVALAPVLREPPRITNAWDCTDDWPWMTAAVSPGPDEVSLSVRSLVLASLGKRRSFIINDRLLMAQESSRDVDQEVRQGLRLDRIDSIAQIEPLDLRGRDLVGADFAEALMPRARLEEAQLDGVSFESAHLVHADLRRGQLRRADFDSANLLGARLDNAILHGADLIGANLRGATLTQASLIGASLLSTQLDGADLSSAELIGAWLRGTKLRGATLRGTNLTGALVDRVDFGGAFLRSVDFSAVELRTAILDHAILIQPRIGRIELDAEELARVRAVLADDSGALADFDMLIEDGAGTRLGAGAGCLLISRNPQLSRLCAMTGFWTFVGEHPAVNLNSTELAFWQGFSALAVAELCAAPKGIDPEPANILPGFRQIEDELILDLRSKYDDDTVIDVKDTALRRWNVISDIVLDDLSTPRCAKNWDPARVDSLHRKESTRESPDRALLRFLERWSEKLAKNAANASAARPDR